MNNARAFGGLEEDRKGSDPAVATVAATKASGTPPERIARAIDAAPSMALPKGGGAIRPIGEKIQINAATGTAGFTIPLPLSPGRPGETPTLTVAYDSGAGLGPFGIGWRLDLPSITRRTDRGLPLYLDRQDSDAFVLSGHEDLVALEGGDTPRDGFQVRRYAPRIEGAFARIERWTPADGPAHWRSISANNVVTLYGARPDSRIADPADPSRVFSWLADEIVLPTGGCTLIDYMRDAGGDRPGFANPQRLPKRIRYGAAAPKDHNGYDRFLFELAFDYGDHAGGPAGALPGREPTGAPALRPDAFSVRRAGFEIRTTALCERVLLFHRLPDGRDQDALLTRSLSFAYARNPAASRLVGASLTGHAITSAGVVVAQSGPPASFTYQGLPDRPEPQIFAPGVLTPDEAGLVELPAGFAADDVAWVDLAGDGAAGALIETGVGWLFKPNLSPLATADVPAARLGGAVPVAEHPAGGRGDGLRLEDIDGDGLIEAVRMTGPDPGVWARREDGGWETFRPFAGLPQIDWASPDLRLLDLTGDGRADLTVAEDERLAWHASHGMDGFGALAWARLADGDAAGPREALRDATGSVFVADMTGDGLADIVRVEARVVSYWPNLGYGRFGERIVMADSPRLDADGPFDPERVRLADTDGSGVADIVYLGETAWTTHRNYVGNSFAPPQRWTTPPPLDVLSRVQAFDLLGNGTACLVWSSRDPARAGAQLRYLPLAGGRKPHLLTQVNNGLGLVTRLSYAPSTAFAIRDRLAGRPWATRLPFPVQVVERVETEDRVAGRALVSRYAYHHGFYDGHEREYHGFGFVEQFDSESFGAPLVPAANGDEAYRRPPVRVRRWFHTGRSSPDGSVSPFYAADFFGAGAGPGRQRDLSARLFVADAALPPDLSAADLRDACRALKGALLREEIADDPGGSDMEPIPYSITVHGHEVVVRQPRRGDQPAIMQPLERESLSVALERSLDAPRVGQSFVLERGPQGQPIATLSVAHGGPAPPFPGEAAQSVTRTHAELERIGLTNMVDLPDALRLPATAESYHHAMAGAALQAPWPLRLADVRTLVERAQDADALDPAAEPCGRVLTGRTRNLYRRDDLKGPLPPGVQEPLGLPFESQQLAFTPALRAACLGADGPDDAAIAQAGYRDLEGDGGLWVPGGRSFFLRGGLAPDQAADAAERAVRAQAEQNEARAHFYLPRTLRDAFGGAAHVDYRLDLFPAAGEDRVGNVSTAEHDARTLQPVVVTDPNLNRSFAAYDAMGGLAAVSLAGKAEAAEAGTPEGDLPPDADAVLALTDVDALLEALSDPARGLQAAASALGRATTRTLGDPTRYHRTGRPCAAVMLARETHAADLAPGASTRIGVSITYLDGAGQPLQTKTLVDPGPLQPGGPDLPVRWIASSWTIHDHKGAPVRAFEPFFSASPAFEPNVRAGVSTISFYDPLGRPVGALHPDGAIEKTRVTPWTSTVWDANDTALITDHAADPDLGPFIRRLPAADRPVAWSAQRTAGLKGEAGRRAAAAAAIHAETPGRTYTDALGRPVLVVADGGGELAVTATLYDDRGHPAVVIDALGRACARNHHDLLGRPIRRHSMEAGLRVGLPAIDDNPAWARDSRGHVARHRHDAARRLVAVTVEDATGAHLRQKVVYGEALGAALNHRGRVHQTFDGAGVAAVEAYDFKGAPRLSTRRFVRDAQGQPDWNTAPPLADEQFSSRAWADALGRPVQTTTPLSSRPGAFAGAIRPSYDHAGRVAAVDVWLDLPAAPDAPLDTATATRRAVRAVEHDAKGRRTRVLYGNGVETRHSFDPVDQRLTAIRTTRGAGFPADAPGDVQNFAYTYDAVGNIIEIADAAQQPVFFRNQVCQADRRYLYDPFSRLIEARGREHRGQGGAAPPTWDDIERQAAHPEDGTAMRTYVESYVYDLVGNLKQMRHVADGGDWTRLYAYEEPSLLGEGVSNRLSHVELGGQRDSFDYDPHGNVTRTGRLAALVWDDADRLASVDLGGGGRADYQYDGSGQRVRKRIVRTGAGGVAAGSEERFYLGGFEICREVDASGALTREREYLQVADGQKVFLDIETRTRGVGGPARLWRHRFDDHLGSSALELDETAAILSYEEYHPYGSTAYQGVQANLDAPKRYRFTGKERDGETGFTYHGARYYAPWLGRWMACDPAGFVDGPNLYAYVSGNPVRLLDSSGREGEEPKLMGAWEYGKAIANKAGLGKNIQGDHPIQVALRKLETLGEYNRNLSKAEHEFVVLAETGKGLFHTELGKLQYDIALRKIAGDLYLGLKSTAEGYAEARGESIVFPKPDPKLILSESQLIEETRAAYAAAAKATGATVDAAALDKAILSHMGTLFTTGGNVGQKLEAAPSLVKVIDMLGGMSRFAKAMDMIAPALAAAKPILKVAGPVGIVVGGLMIAKEAHAAGTAPTASDAAIHTLDMIKEGMYLGSMRMPHLLIPALAMSATEYADQKIGFTDQAAKDAHAIADKVTAISGNSTLGEAAGLTAAVGLSWTYALTPQGWARMAAAKLQRK
ncbi:SpvB/TcaC N-terminal domain-containing protein [Methylorubrum rhodesianum]|uniref:SpvB/TcaC N-terminal domain-containing protein n=1 Tax=Methylorubrum rhodesianum TaxID=29427 RepID=UPI003D270C4D